MYRQVFIENNQRDLQRIVWRNSPSEEIGHFRLTTVTYGTSSAPYLAVLESAESLKKDLKNLLNAYGFPLRKWLSNCPEVLEQVDEANSPIYHVSDGETRKTLGVHWCAKTDTLNYSVNPDDFKLSRVTKRTILSAVSTIFDPLGTITPITIKAKLLIQELWKSQVGWDAPIPQPVAQMWNDFTQNLAQLNTFSLPRQVTVQNACQVELHAFCDASQRAYGSCIYLRTISPQGITVRLLCSKSRVAPLKTITLPRLELSGALLMAQLVHRVQKSLKMTLDRICYWTDSTIVLAWIAAPPTSWKFFVANRVAEIQRMTNINEWRHVLSQDNPADLVSRGMDINKAHSCTLWWYGPPWLIQDQASWPRSTVQEEPLPDRRKISTSLVSRHIDPTILQKYSTLYKLQKVVSYCMRFIQNTSHKTTHQTGPITTQEFNKASVALIKISQAQDFPVELECLAHKRELSKKSPINRLDPFLDANGCLRVGGRAKSHLTLLVIRQEHHRQLHAGPQTLLASLRQKFWPLGGLNTIKGVLRKCLTCFRVSPASVIQKMGNLPKERVIQSRPFSISGVDLAGPFSIKDGRLRNRAIIKAYLCIFVCFSTKAVHLEAVVDLSTDSFLN
nr:unnamed protein product [Callosobruchus analis]